MSSQRRAEMKRTRIALGLLVPMSITDNWRAAVGLVHPTSAAVRAATAGELLGRWHSQFYVRCHDGSPYRVIDDGVNIGRIA